MVALAAVGARVVVALRVRVVLALRVLVTMVVLAVPQSVAAEVAVVVR
jgi:hypothetical protein